MTDKEKIGKLAIMMYELNLQGIDVNGFTKLFPDYAERDIIKTMWLLYCVVDAIRDKQNND